MRLKDRSKNDPIIRNVRKHFPRAKVLIIILIVFFYSALMIATGAFLYRVRRGNAAKYASSENLKIPINYIKSLFVRPESITIDIKHIDFQKLAYQREDALARGVLIVDDDYVPAAIQHGGESVKVNIRLKGDWVYDNLKGDKWSFRVKVKGENTLFGMKQFSLHHPKVRNYIYEWIFHKALKREGVPGLRYEFIKVVLNGKDWGIYALEEHFEKRLIENNRLREGPIVRFNENLTWANHLQNPSALFGSGVGSYLSSDVDAFHTNEMLSEPSYYSQHNKAIHLLESFRCGNLKTCEVFNIQKLAKFFAITDLMGAEHGSRWHNTRFYYNPITSELEPIGFDGNCGVRISSLCATFRGVVIDFGSPRRHNYYATIFSDPVFFREYVKALERVSERAYLDELFDELDDELKRNLKILQKEFSLFHFSEDVLYQNQGYIRSVLNPVKGLHAYYHKSSGDQVGLELGNIQSMPIEVLNVSYKDFAVLQPVRSIILSPKMALDPVDYQDAVFALSQDVVWSDEMITDLKVNYRILGASQIRSETIFPWSHLDRNFVRQKPNFGEFDFLIVDEAAKIISVESGAWNVDQSLIIPEGYTLICGEDTRLNLSNSASIVSYSPLEFAGSEENPISIYSSDSTGQGVAVMNAGRKSVLEHVIFSNLSNPSRGGWELTGAVTFYESPVDIHHCQFIANRAEDSLNIVRSEFTIDETAFSGAFSDAFDADFTKGSIIKTSFVNCGNDACDVSGSIVGLRDIFIKDVGDKGLSVGEDSRVFANRIEIRDAEIALASKDASSMGIKDISISDSEVGFAVYRKKPEFGSASITAVNLEAIKITVPHLVEAGSSLVIDGVAVKPNHDNVDELLYGSKYGKSSR
ncbi:CotH kinase family protein [Candidatus Poribacteria bacterium]